MQIVDGIVADINDQSGSYGTTGLMSVDRRMARAILSALRLAKVPISDAVVDSLEV